MQAKKSYLMLYFLMFNAVITISQIANAQCDGLENINLRKTAFIIGNNDYKYVSRLDKSVNDANDMADSLRLMNYEVSLYVNESYNNLQEAMENWISNLKKYQVAFFYFSGHGFEFNATNYLLPVDANPQSPNELSLHCLSANSVMERVSGQGVRFNILILDACRSNPFPTSWVKNNTTPGLGSMSGVGTFIGFAAQPNKVALEGKNRNGYYTEAILKYITEPNLTIDQLFTKVNNHVRQNTNDLQIPFKNSSLSAEYCFSITTKFKSNNSRSITNKGGRLVINERNELIFLADSSIEIRSLTSNRFLRKIPFKNFKPNYIMHISGDKLIVTDSSKNKIILLETGTNRTDSIVIIEHTPNKIFRGTSNDFIYFTYSNNITNGFCKVNLITKKVTATNFSSSKIHDILVSPNDEALWILYKDSLKYLTPSISRTKKNRVDLSNIQNGILSKKGDEIILLRDSGSSSMLTFFDTENLKKFNKTTNLTSPIFSSDRDSLLYSYTDKIFLVASMQNGKVISSQHLPYRILDFQIIDEDHIAFLMDSDRKIHIYDISKLIESKFIDPEYKLKKFKEDEANFLRREREKYTKDDFNRFKDTIRWQIEGEIRGIIKDLNFPHIKELNEVQTISLSNEFEQKPINNNTLYFDFKTGFNSTITGTRIGIYFPCELTNGSLKMEAYFYIDGKKFHKSFVSNRSGMDLAILREFIRAALIEKVDLLRSE